jgi:hypothetical protein
VEYRPSSNASNIIHSHKYTEHVSKSGTAEETREEYKKE